MFWQQAATLGESRRRWKPCRKARNSRAAVAARRGLSGRFIAARSSPPLWGDSARSFRLASSCRSWSRLLPGGALEEAIAIMQALMNAPAPDAMTIVSYVLEQHRRHAPASAARDRLRAALLRRESAARAFVGEAVSFPSLGNGEASSFPYRAVQRRVASSARDTAAGRAGRLRGRSRFPCSRRTGSSDRTC